MKKIFIIGLGSLFIATLIATPFSEASRDVYHSYLYNQHLEKKENRFSPYSYSNRIVKQSRVKKERKKIRNQRYPVGNKRNLYTRHSYSSSRSLRPSSSRILAFRRSTSDRNLRIRRISKVLNNFETQEYKDFSIQVPSSMEKKGENYFFNEVNGLSFLVKHVEECNGISFTSCAIAVGKDANSTTTRDKISNISRIQRQLTKGNTILDDISIKTEIFTETFEGIYLGKELFISRYFVADGLGGVYMIEAQTSKRNGARDMGIIKKVFDSFRIK
ncbi:hypothetical protein KAI58_04625 [Candidatus Gracilibacteria bacterium]|nr:hypothetical protein [Candidatus Gracilibacteria bacterium]